VEEEAREGGEDHGSFSFSESPLKNRWQLIYLRIFYASQASNWFSGPGDVWAWIDQRETLRGSKGDIWYLYDSRREPGRREERQRGNIGEHLKSTAAIPDGSLPNPIEK